MAAYRAADRAQLEGRSDFRRALALADVFPDRRPLQAGSVDSVLGPLGTLAAEIGWNTGRATVEDPGQAVKANLGFLRDITLGLPGGVVGAVKDPGAVPGAIVDDYSKFYGPAVRGDWKAYRENVKQQGALRVAVDAPLPGAVLGKAGGTLAKAGALGAKARRAVTETRPLERYSFGEGAARPMLHDESQRAFPNLFRALHEKRTDRRAGERHAREVRQARRQAVEGPTRTERLFGIERRTPVLEPRGGAFGGREVVPSAKRAERAQRHAAAKRKGQAVNEIHRLQGEEVGAARKALKGLSKWETRAWAFAHRGLVTPDDPAAAVRQLEVRLSKLEAERTAGGKVPSIFQKDEAKLIRSLIAHADEAFTPAVRKAAEKTGTIERRVAADNPALHPAQAELRRHAQQANLLGVDRLEGESNGAYLARVKKAAEKQGLPAPSYMPSEELFQSRFSHYAAGGGKAAPDYRAYTGATHRGGTEYLHPEVFFQGLARGIKTKVNWRLVEDLVDEHAHPKLRNMSVRQIRKQAERRGLDPSEYVVWVPGRFRRQARALGDETSGDVHGADFETPAEIAEAIEGSVFELDDPRLGEFRDVKATIVPRAMLDEVLSGAKGSGPLGRSLDVARTKASRLVLGAYNLPWVQVGFAANALVMATRGVTPIALLKGARWYSKLPAADKRLLAQELELEQSKLQDLYKPQMGAAITGKTVFGRMANVWRSYRRTPWGQTLRPFEKSINAFLRFERRLNSDAFRKALFHAEAKRTAFREIDRKAGLANGIIARTQSLLTIKGPEKQLEAIIRNRKQLERHGELVSEILGDWQTFTGFERRYLGKMFFYPYLRYSLRWTFLTMPVRHPVMGQLLAQLGRMNAEDVREILGGDALPFQLGKLYFTKDGQVREIDLSNIDPAGNVVTELKGSEGLLGLMPPYVQLGLTQILKYDPYFGRKLRVKGHTEYDADKVNLDAWTRARVLLNDLAGMTPVGRELMRQTTKGFQGDDALPFSPRPTVYKSDEKRKQNRELAARQSAGGVLGQLLEHQLPFMSRPSRDPELARAAKRKRRKKPRRRGGGGIDLGTGGGGGIRLGTGGGGGISLGGG